MINNPRLKKKSFNFKLIKNDNHIKHIIKMLEKRNEGEFYIIHSEEELSLVSK